MCVYANRFCHCASALVRESHKDETLTASSLTKDIYEAIERLPIVIRFIADCYPPDIVSPSMSQSLDFFFCKHKNSNSHGKSYAHYVFIVHSTISRNSLLFPF